MIERGERRLARSEGSCVPHLEVAALVGRFGRTEDGHLPCIKIAFVWDCDTKTFYRLAL